MIISGFAKRSISDQRDVIDFNLDVTLSNGLARAEVGFSGTNVFKFTFENGRIYDNNQNFFGSYVRDVPVTLSGQLGQKSFDYFLNGNLVGLEQPVGTGVYSWIFANPSGCSIELDAEIKGSNPTYIADQSGFYRHQNYVITGNVINITPNLNFRIFDAEITQDGSPYEISSFTTGNIGGNNPTGRILITSSDFSTTDYLLPITLSTNFGPVNLSFFISGNNVSDEEVYLSVSPNIFEVINNVRQGYSIHFSNFPSDAQVNVSLQYVSGITGNIYDILEANASLSKVISGIVSGSGVISSLQTGLVSGLDPSTLIVETGRGSGILQTEVIYPTGIVTFPWVERITGMGAGSITLVNLLANGATSGLFQGSIRIQGSNVTAIAYNYIGTGVTNGLATGIVPTGTGQVFVRPTGTFPLASGLSPSDYDVVNLSAPKVVQGILTQPFSIPAIGPADGFGNFTGIVGSDFSLIVEPGFYRFTKHYSGAVFGKALHTGNFNPALQCPANDPPVVSGIITGFFAWTGYLNCTNLNSLPLIPITGVPVVTLQDGNPFTGTTGVTLIRPSGGFSRDENSVYLSRTGNTRTRISRNGVTPSGSGYFSGVINECGQYDGIWRETINVTSNTSGRSYSNTNTLSEIAMKTWCTGTGNFILADKRYINVRDSGYIDFKITGSGQRMFGFRGLANSLGGPKGLRMFLHSGGIPIDYYDKGGTPDLIPFGKRTDDFEVGGLTLLGRGDYRLTVLAYDTVSGEIEFVSNTFVGCETDGYMQFQVQRIGDPRGPASVDYGIYTDITAISGFHYHPVTGTFNWGSFDTSIRSFYVPIKNNSMFSWDQVFSVELTNPSGLDLSLTKYIASGVIQDEDSYLLMTGIASGYNSRTGFTSGHFRNLPTPLCLPVTPVFDDDEGDSYVPDPITTGFCECGDNRPPTGGPLSGICVGFCAGGVGVTNHFQYVGEFCSMYCTAGGTSECVGCTVMKVRMIPSCYFPSGYLEVGSGYSGIGRIPSSSGMKGTCCPLAVFVKVKAPCGIIPTWSVCVSGTSGLFR